MIPKLEVNGVSYSYHSLDGETLALDHISFDVSPGEFLAIVGPSGCGKSTLLSMLCGLTQPEGGTITIDGVRLTKSPSAIGYMLQKDHLFEWRNIFSNISLGLEIQKRLDEPARLELLDMMSAYGLAGFEYAKPSELSGGMRQRAALLRTYLFSGSVALLDEPFSALDMLTKKSVHNWYLKVMDEIHLSTLFITHDIDEAILLSDRIYLLTGRPGRITEELIIKETKPRDRDFGLTEEFLEYKRHILRHLETTV